LQGQEFMMSGNFNDWEGLNWENAETYKGVVEAHRQLIALRQNKHGVTLGLTGREINLFHVDENNKVIAYHRWQRGGPKDDVVVVINFGRNAFTDYSMSFPRNGKWYVRFCSDDKKYSADFTGTHVPEVKVQSGNGSFVLPASTALILSQE
jgi:1,4-alpha-glucan branching enzyme